MKYKMYSIHDSAVKAFLPPHFARTDEEASRNFTSNVNNKENGHLYNSPGNFSLFYVGRYDDDTGLTEATVPPELIMNGIQVKEDERQLKMAGT